MPTTVPALKLRVGYQPLTAVEHDSNLTILKNFCDALSAQIASSISLDGSLVTNAVITASITDRAVTAAKLAFTAGCSYHEDVSSEANVIAINPNPVCTAFEVGMVFIIHLPVNKQTNSRSVKLEVNGLIDDSAASVLKSGGIELDAGTLKANSLIVVGCVAAAPAKFIMLGVTSVSNSSTTIITGGEIFNGSFEAVAGQIPDGWLVVTTPLSGGSPALTVIDGDDVNVRHGGKSVKFTLVAGTSRNWLSLQSILDAKYPCVEGEDVQITWLMSIVPGTATTLNIPVRLLCKWYDSSGNYIRSGDLFARKFVKGTAPVNTGWFRYSGAATPPAAAHFYQLSIACGDPEVEAADHNNAEVYFDDVRTARASYDFRSALKKWDDPAGIWKNTVVLHGFGTVPSRVECYAECHTVQAGFTVGSSIRIDSFTKIGTEYIHVYFNDSSIGFTSNYSELWAHDPVSGGHTILDPASWGWRFYAWV